LKVEEDKKRSMVESKRRLREIYGEKETKAPEHGLEISVFR
jgi:hypothetical protein